VLEAVRWPCAIRASPGVSRPNPLREDRGKWPTAAGAFSTATEAPLLPADQQRATGIVQPWTMTRLERCTPLTSVTRAAWTRGSLLHPKSSLKENPAQ